MADLNPYITMALGFFIGACANGALMTKSQLRLIRDYLAELSAVARRADELSLELAKRSPLPDGGDDDDPDDGERAPDPARAGLRVA